jgi:hypothetical protein
MVDYLTREDVDNFGSDLINFAQRAAAQALSPQLQSIQQQNAELAQRLAQEQRHRLDQAVEQAIPNYRDVDRSPGWHQFLRTVDPLSGRIRQVLLNDAIQQADAPRVISFFRSYLREGGGPADHQAPGQPRQSHGSAPSGRTYSRAEIGRLYEQHRKGLLTGEAWARQEADIFSAQRDGRVVDYPYLTK